MISIVVALLLAFTGVLLLGPLYIGLLQRLGFGKRIRTEGPESHQVKAGTPTMGGMLIVLVVMFLAMAMRIEDSVTLTPMLALVGVGILGAIDDYVNARTGVGMRGRWKLVWQTAVALLAAFYVQRHFNITVLNVPFLGEVVVGALFFALFMAFVIVGVSNAVNLTDGLDGLAAGVLIFSFVAYLLIALFDPPGPLDPQPNLAIFCALLTGALMGFLWFNVHPAQIFMGDSGSLGLGATLAVVATLSRQLPLLMIIGIVFFAVIMSVVLQVVSFRHAWTANLPLRAAAASFRADRLGGGEDHGPLLDRQRAGRAAGLQPLPGHHHRAVLGPMQTMTAPLPLTSTADLRGRRVLVLGLARSGVAASRMLIDAGAEVTAYDRRSADDLADALAGLEGRTPSLALGVEPAEAERLLAAAELVVTSPSISARFPTTEAWLRQSLAAAEARGVTVLGEVDLFLSLTRARVLAVTGTKGKTTTTALIGAMLDAAGLPHAVGGTSGRR